MKGKNRVQKKAGRQREEADLSGRSAEKGTCRLGGKGVCCAKRSGMFCEALEREWFVGL